MQWALARRVNLVQERRRQLQIGEEVIRRGERMDQPVQLCMGAGGGEERTPSEGLGWPAMAEEPDRFEANRIYMGSRLEANTTGRELERRRGARG
jgi:hypothetical protein